MVSKEQVKKVSENARINLSDGEVEKFSQEFEKILNIFNKLEELDTKGVKPAFHPVEIKPDTRKDREEETLNSEQVFTNTENTEDGWFKGPSA